jgi:hypothetical protein
MSAEQEKRLDARLILVEVTVLLIASGLTAWKFWRLL